MGHTRNGQYYGKLERNTVYNRARDTLAIEMGYKSIEELEFLAKDHQDTEMILLSVNEMAEKEVAKYSPRQLSGTLEVHNG